MTGTLYIVSTPIGNLEDITARAVRVLEEADTVACEDTRVTLKLLNHLGIKKRLVSYHEQNEVARTEELVRSLLSGRDIALVCDAGTPAISDPGYRIVRAAIDNGIDVVPVPGPSAAVSALVVSGLPSARFAFIGFPPKSGKRKHELIESVREYTETLVFYESAARVLDTLAVLGDALGDRRAAVCRELTKKFEETLRGTLTGLADTLRAREPLKGEVVIVVEGRTEEPPERSDESITRILTDMHGRGGTLRESVESVTGELGVAKNRVYRIAIGLWAE